MLDEKVSEIERSRTERFVEKEDGEWPYARRRLRRRLSPWIRNPRPPRRRRRRGARRPARLRLLLRRLLPLPSPPRRRARRRAVRRCEAPGGRERRPA